MAPRGLAAVVELISTKKVAAVGNKQRFILRFHFSDHTEAASSDGRRRRADLIDFMARNEGSFCHEGQMATSQHLLYNGEYWELVCEGVVGE